jgi:indole-3-acetate monooxygenase
MLQLTPEPEIPQAVEVSRLAKEAETRWVEFDERCSVPADLFEQAARIGLFRQLVPTDLGGLGSTPLEWYRTGLDISRHQPSLGWVVSQGAAVLGQLAVAGDPDWVAEVLSDPVAAVAASIAGGGTLHPDGDGGYCFSGRWSFTSGCEGATWLGGLSVVKGCEPDLVFLYSVVPADRARVERTWDATGLRGTGSHTVVVDEQSVPTTWSFASDRPARHRSDAARCLVSNGNWPIGVSVASTQLGIARRALDEVAALLPHKAPAPLLEPLSTSSSVQRALMEAEGLWHATNAGVEAALGRLWEAAEDRQELDTRLRVEIATANATANRLAVQMVDRACELVGTSMTPVDHPLSRAIRDAVTLRGHISTNGAVMERAARVRFGDEEPAWTV